MWPGSPPRRLLAVLSNAITKGEGEGRPLSWAPSAHTVAGECGMELRPEDLQTLQRVHTMSIHQRPHKVTVADFVDVQAWQARGALRALFPRILKGQDIAAVIDGLVA